MFNYQRIGGCKSGLAKNWSKTTGTTGFVLKSWENNTSSTVMPTRFGRNKTWQVPHGDSSNSLCSDPNLWTQFWTVLSVSCGAGSIAWDVLSTQQGGFHKWGYPQMDGLQGKLPSRNGWWLGGTPIYGTPQIHPTMVFVLFWPSKIRCW